jgi:hypothetical protein
MSEFTDKHRQRFRRLLEVAHSTTFDGEREAALGAATRLADTYGMTLREAAGMAEAAEPKPKPAAPRRPAKPKANEWTGAVHAQKFQEALHPRHKNDGPTPPKFESEMDGIIADKKRFEKAMQDAIGRGLDAEEIRKRARMAAMEASARKRSSRRWRPRAEFIRVLLKETQMTVREIAATAGVPINDVIREKLLLRNAQVNPEPA